MIDRTQLKYAIVTIRARLDREVGRIDRELPHLEGAERRNLRKHRGVCNRELRSLDAIEADPHDNIELAKGLIAEYEQAVTCH